MSTPRHDRSPSAGRPTVAEGPTVIVLMGVAGSGKTTIGQKLATTLGWIFRDADEFHSAANVAKMAAGQPLTDADRQPWLLAIRAFIDDCVRTGVRAVVTCSALKDSYRAVLTRGRPETRLVHLAGSYPLIRQRLEHRTGHFLPPEMLASQFATLEPPRDALTIDIAPPPDVIVAEIRAAFSV